MLRFRTVAAHCDIPCKIYDPAVAQVSALSVVRLMDIIAEVGVPNTPDESAKLARVVMEKEEQAGIVKAEINIIWGDFFKAPQIEAHPGVHDLVHRIMQAGSACKQGIDRADGEKLLTLVNEFAEMFWQSKGVETQSVRAPYPPELPVCQPILERA